jgi:hypothetical protein
MRTSLPLPPHYDSALVGQVWRVPYAQRAAEAEAWAGRHGLQPVSNDKPRVALLAVDVQNTFCIPGYELFVGGRSGNGAVEDNQRLCEFIYRNLDVITQVFPTLDTHSATQIFHPVFFHEWGGRTSGAVYADLRPRYRDRCVALQCCACRDVGARSRNMCRSICCTIRAR